VSSLLAGDPTVGLVDSPRPVRVPEFRAAAAVQFPPIPLGPTPERYVIHTAIRSAHDLFQLSKVSDTAGTSRPQHNALSFEVSPFEKCRSLPCHLRRRLPDGQGADATEPHEFYAFATLSIATTMAVVRFDPRLR
jgi:hypothetical protein